MAHRGQLIPAPCSISWDNLTPVGRVGEDISKMAYSHHWQINAGYLSLEPSQGYGPEARFLSMGWGGGTVHQLLGLPHSMGGWVLRGSIPREPVRRCTVSYARVSKVT